MNGWVDGWVREDEIKNAKGERAERAGGLIGRIMDGRIILNRNDADERAREKRKGQRGTVNTLFGVRIQKRKSLRFSEFSAVLSPDSVAT